MVVKILSKAGITLQQYQDIRREVGYLQRLDHDHIMCILDVDEDEDYVYIVSPLAQGMRERERGEKRRKDTKVYVGISQSPRYLQRVSQSQMAVPATSNALSEILTACYLSHSNHCIKPSETLHRVPATSTAENRLSSCGKK